MKKIDLIMLSNLEQSGGGRETWLKNFLDNIVVTDREIKFDLYTLKTNEDCLLNEYNYNLVNKHKKYNHNKKKLPISIGFVSYMARNLIFKKKYSEHMLAVGGLEEALAGVLGYTIRNVKGKKILWLRTIYTKEKGYALNKITQKILLTIELLIIKNFFDIVIANGEDTADFYRNLGVECVVIKNSIPLEKWNTLKSTRNHNKLKIAFIGRLTEVKGIQNFLDAINIIYNAGNIKDFEFHIVGDGPYAKELEKYIELDEVITYGAIHNSQVPDILKEMDCCVALTYLTDFLGGGGVSNALIEQMATGKILVCWDNNIFRKVLDEKSAYFVAQGDSQALAETFINIKNDLPTADIKAICAKSLSHDYSIQNHVNNFFKLIQRD